MSGNISVRTVTKRKEIAWIITIVVEVCAVTVALPC